MRTNPNSQNPPAGARESKDPESVSIFPGRVLHSHALEDAGERIGYCSTQGTDEDHVSGAPRPILCAGSELIPCTLHVNCKSGDDGCAGALTDRCIPSIDRVVARSCRYD